MLFTKKDVEKEHQKLKLVKKIEQVHEWELHDTQEVHFATLVLPLHCYSGNRK